MELALARLEGSAVKPSRVEYYSPGTTEQAVDLLGRYGDEASPLAGGQSLVPLLSLRMAAPWALIDLNQVPQLDVREFSPDGVRIGAMASHRSVESDSRITGTYGAIADAVPLIGHVAIRNRGTIGGSIAHADPSAEWPALCVLLSGVIEVTSPRGVRYIEAEDLFLGFLSVALEPDELLTSIWFEHPGMRTGTAFSEFARRHGDYAIVGVGASLRRGNDERIEAARICLTGVGPSPCRVRDAETVLVGQEMRDPAFTEAAELVTEEIDPPSDLQGDTSYRRHLAKVLTQRVLPSAAHRTREGVEPCIQTQSP